MVPTGRPKGPHTILELATESHPIMDKEIPATEIALVPT
jgi:hypothetical protein